VDIRKQNLAISDSLLACAKKLYTLKYEMSNGGNMSARVPGTDYMIVKGTNVAFGDVTMDALVVTDFDGNVMEGDVKPSKEALLHGALYRRFPELKAVMHCHSPWATAWSAEHDTLEFSTYHSKVKLKGYCPVFDVGEYVVPASWFPTILDDIAAHPGMSAFILRAHGQVALSGKSIEDATNIAELVEETAMITLLAKLSRFN
jgi:ribulose-5-phosphate 4-epimerase/fuculose-1-phosphate aldolase